MHPMLNIAIQAARKSGKLLLQAQERLDKIEVHPKGKRDYSTNLDRASEKAIIETIQKHYPGHSIIAEESGLSEGSDPQVPTWIIDPLDGTKNFVHGHPHFSISIAVQVKNNIEVALIYDPLRDEIFSAVKGQGAQKDGKRLRMKPTAPSLEEALLCFSSGSKNLFPLASQCGGIRNSGSACLDLAYLASGRIDGLIHTRLKVWDLAAGILILQEAGAMVTNFRGESDLDCLFKGQIVAGPAKIHGQLLEACQKLASEQL